MGTYEEFLQALGNAESGGQYAIINRFFYLGKYQMGEAALQDAGYYLGDTTAKNDWTGGWTGKDGIYSETDFLTNSQAQENAIRAYVEKQWSYIKSDRYKLDQYLGQTINGITVTESGLIAAAHLGGIGNLDKYFKSGGTEVFSDANRTSIESYLKKFAGYDLGLANSGIAPSALPDYYTAFDLFLNGILDALSRVRDFVSGLFTSAQTWVAPTRRDPLVLDLDADGLETTALNTANPILFDHDGDGVKTATGWVSADDGFLVLDRNGNGTIDSGRELFGDATLIPDGQGGQRTAVDGFEALTAQDTNLDGKVSSLDTNFANLRIWQDLNQNGISEANELFTLTQKNIASINVTKTENNTLLPNGNVIADLGQYTKLDGIQGTLGETAQLGDVDLRENTFYSQFTDPVALTPAAQTLPNMNGSGQVRDLREAVSLSPDLTTILTNYTQATTRDAQRALLDPLTKAWSDTSTMATTATGAYEDHPLTITFEGITPGSPEHQAWLDKLTVLERFNGRTFRVVPTGTDPVTLAFSGGQMSLLDQSYNALKESLYGAHEWVSNVKHLRLAA